MKFYLEGPLGFETAEKLYMENKEKADLRFPGFFVEDFLSIRDDMIKMPEGKESVKWQKDEGVGFALPENEVYAYSIEEGGLFAAIWKACEALKMGCEIELDKIFIRQEIVEILELFGENPYECSSLGAYLVLRPDNVYPAVAGSGGQGEKCSAIYIGHTTSAPKRVVVFNGNERFLTPPARQKKDIEDRKRK